MTTKVPLKYLPKRLTQRDRKIAATELAKSTNAANTTLVAKSPHIHTKRRVISPILSVYTASSTYAHLANLRRKLGVQ